MLEILVNNTQVNSAFVTKIQAANNRLSNSTARSSGTIKVLMSTKRERNRYMVTAAGAVLANVRPNMVTTSTNKSRLDLRERKNPKRKKG